MNLEEQGQKRSGLVGLIGLANAGKSTLTNALVGEKVSIVSSKPQTTRTRVQGLLTEGLTQIVFVDTPGWISGEAESPVSEGLRLSREPSEVASLNHLLAEELTQALDDVDMLIVLLNVDAKPIERLETILSLARAANKPRLVLVNKMDLLESEPQRSETLARLEKWLEGEPHFFISALKGAHAIREPALRWIREHLPPVEEFYFGTDEYTTQTLRQMAAEIVREKCFEFLHQEIPYGLAVKIEKFEEADDQSSVTKIFAQLVVAKENHRGMVIGQGGLMLKRIGTAARIELERLIGGRVYLALHVDVQRNWQKDSARLRELGCLK